MKMWSRMEYDADGRLTARLVHNANGSEWTMRYTYDNSGRMLKIESGNEGQPLTETIYSYSDQGRPLKITSNRTPDNPVTFHYDDSGRRTKIQRSSAADYMPNVASAVPPFDSADRPPNLPGGGTATTVHDEQDRPTEVQVRDSQGEVVSRSIRKYDEHGRIAEEHHILDNPETMIPAELRTRILSESGRSLVELRSELTRLMGGQAGPSSIAYDYDAHSRIIQTRRRIFNRERIIETSY